MYLLINVSLRVEGRHYGHKVSTNRGAQASEARL